MLVEQERIADETRAFLKQWGLKGKYVAGVCKISTKVFSQFLNHRLALSRNQMCRLVAFVEDYQRRNS